MYCNKIQIKIEEQLHSKLCEHFILIKMSYWWSINTYISMNFTIKITPKQEM